jgi:uncharacterized protein YbjT (DUF2867 family)
MEGFSQGIDWKPGVFGCLRCHLLINTTILDELSIIKDKVAWKVLRKSFTVEAMKETTLLQETPTLTQTTLVLGGNGKTGRRVIRQLEERGLPVRIGSRTADPAFDWNDPSGWDEVLEGVSSIYIAYHPDLAAPGAAEAIETLVDLARKHGVRKLVLLSGRGEEEAQRCEAIVQASGIPHTIVRCAWFNQNFSENFLREMVLDGKIALPLSGVREPFVDVEDIADVSVAALTGDGHDGELYELTGPGLLTFEEAAAEISRITGREIRFQTIPREDFLAGLQAMELPRELISLVDYLFTEVLDGRNESIADGVQRALGRPPRRFADYAAGTFAEGHWNA